MLVTVMIITAVGLLFGAGALLMFRYQCQMRIDRQHELEKVYAVRSALNFTRTYLGTIDDSGKPFRYYTGSERDLGLLVKPVEAIFPQAGNTRHFDMTRAGDFKVPFLRNYNSLLDYEYGASFSVTNWSSEMRSLSKDDSRRGLAFTNTSTNGNVRWWVNIGMRGTGGWLQEDYGRRYFFTPMEYVDGTMDTKDIMRLCIIRNVTNELNAAGARHGWPLSQKNERALVFQIVPKAGSNDNSNNADMHLYEYACDGESVEATRILSLTNCPSLCDMGIQLAGDKVTMFFINNAKQAEAKPSSRGYTFSPSGTMSKQTYDYFSSEVFIGGKSYGGIYTNDEMKVQAPELRAVLEVEAASDARPMPDSKKQENFLTNFSVTPAYQYDVFLEHPASVTNRATVAQKIGDYGRGGLQYTILTYDTHGTEHKGFKQDERELERSGRK